MKLQGSVLSQEMSWENRGHEMAAKLGKAAGWERRGQLLT